VTIKIRQILSNEHYFFLKICQITSIFSENVRVSTGADVSLTVWNVNKPFPVRKYRKLLVEFSCNNLSKLISKELPICARNSEILSAV
jgi:hypothetical protein